MKALNATTTLSTTVLRLHTGTARLIFTELLTEIQLSRVLRKIMQWKSANSRKLLPSPSAAKPPLWSYPDDENTTTRTYFDSSEPSSSEGLEIGTTAVSVSPTGTGISDGLLIFPNQDSQNAQNPRELSIAVTLSGLEESPKTVSFPLRNVDETGNDTGPFIFESNHEYTLLITVLDDDVRTIAIAPQVYEDIIVPLDPPLGQPVTFANLMWMDRNLGATSADCENDWENTRGYYYQY